MPFVYPSSMRDSGYGSETNSGSDRIYYSDEELPEDIALEWLGINADGSASPSSESASSSSPSSAPSSPEWEAASDDIDSSDSVSGE
jgi:hypothetical protein